MLNKVKHLIERFRSAITGRYVTKDYAEQNPDTTVEETYVDRDTGRWK